MGHLKIRKQILRNYAEALVNLEENGIPFNSQLAQRIIQEATRVGVAIYRREKELRENYFICYCCKGYYHKATGKRVKDKELIEELKLVRLKENECGLCEFDFYS